MKMVVAGAHRMPGHVILGPSFVARNGDRHALIGTATDLAGGTGVMVAAINLAKFFSVFSKDYLAHGFRLRLMERDGAAGQENVFIPVIGSAEAPPGVARTEIARITIGQTRWDLHWDILPVYLGGPADGSGRLVAVGGTSLSIFIALLIGYLSSRNSRMQPASGGRKDQLIRDSVPFQRALDAIDQGIAFWNGDERLVLWNERCLDFWRLPKERVRIDMPMRELREHLAEQGIYGGDESFGLSDHDSDQIAEAGDETGAILTSLEGRSVQIRRIPLERGGYVEVYGDVTEHERAREDLEPSRDDLERRIAERTGDLKEAHDRAVIASEAKSEFLAHISHELRTPLNAIIGFSQMSAAQPYGPLGHDKYLEYANIIVSTGEHLLELISDILELSQFESNVVTLTQENVDLTSLTKLAAEIVSTQAAKSNLTISVSIADEASMIYGDGRRLRQMLINLLDNAVKFTLAGGEIHVRIDLDEDNSMAVSVSDNGVGIPEEDLAQITEPFRRSRSNPLIQDRQGAGLGLALVKYLVELHGGALTLESEVGRGTTATLRFPAERTVVSPASPLAATVEHSGSPG